jgi:hypothetical protein
MDLLRSKSMFGERATQEGAAAHLMRSILLSFAGTCWNPKLQIDIPMLQGTGTNRVQRYS